MDPTVIVRDFAYEHPWRCATPPSGPRYTEKEMLLAKALVDINQPTLRYTDPIPDAEDAPYRTYFIDRMILREGWLEKHGFLPVPAQISRATRRRLWRYSRHVKRGYVYSNVQVALLRVQQQDANLFGKRPTMTDAAKPFEYIGEQEAFLIEHGYLPVSDAIMEERIRANRFATTMKDLELASYQGKFKQNLRDLERIAVPLFDVVERSLSQGTGLIPI
ncbi:hypothetical protein BDV96DRAFT_596670 [Lophiotrema nucula]|uniref:Uncharacterized protein n=1 Tax=Lophiotrema nucula TaxID=690887 RepID=A0A6A5ZJ35_9PLEO|nr:hypothetical protein BDV96DRAFT_596670 [Lophiotrema nucula]